MSFLLYETLESRRLLAGNGDVNLQVNFQPSSALTVPSGFRTDIGRTYGRRANGLTYGWSEPNEGFIFDRNHPDAQPLGEQYDTLAQANGRRWSVEVPDGWYSVTLVAGDPNAPFSEHRFSAEAIKILDAQTIPEYRWSEGQAVVEVTDGRLDIEDMDGNSVLNFAYIRSVAAPVEPIAGTDLEFAYSSTAPIERIESGVLRVGNLVYVAGGYTNDYLDVTSRFDVYNVVTETWSRLADLPGAQSHFSFFSDGRYFYKLGGQVGNVGGDRTGNTSDQGWKYDPQRNRWTPWFSLPDARITAKAVYFEGKVHLVGGNHPNGIVAIDDHLVLEYGNTDAGWQRAADLPRAADHAGDLLLDTPDGPRWFLFGGEHGHGVSYVQHKEVFAYDFAADSWERKADMPDAASHFEGNVFYYGGKVWLLGARGNANTRLSNIWSYDIATDRWTTHGSLPQGRFGGASWGVNGKLFFATGDVFGDSRDDILVAEIR